MNHPIARLAAATALLFTPAAALAQDGSLDLADSGDTAWLMTCSALTLLLAAPGLTLYYAGGIRGQNLVSVMIQGGAIIAVSSLLWIMVGYSLAFGPVTNGWLGAGTATMLNGLGNVRAGHVVPESAFALFEMMFAGLAPALMIGAWAGRARFAWVITFCAAWGLIVYAPVAHWIWGGGWLATKLGVVDFAGGIVVHTSAGVSALVAAALVIARAGERAPPPVVT